MLPFYKTIHFGDVPEPFITVGDIVLMTPMAMETASPTTVNR